MKNKNANSLGGANQAPGSVERRRVPGRRMILVAAAAGSLLLAACGSPNSNGESNGWGARTGNAQAQEASGQQSTPESTAAQELSGAYLEASALLAAKTNKIAQDVAVMVASTDLHITSTGQTGFSNKAYLAGKNGIPGDQDDQNPGIPRVAFSYDLESNQINLTIAAAGLSGTTEAGADTEINMSMFAPTPIENAFAQKAEYSIEDFTDALAGGHLTPTDVTVTGPDQAGALASQSMSIDMSGIAITQGPDASIAAHFSDAGQLKAGAEAFNQRLNTVAASIGIGAAGQ